MKTIFVFLICALQFGLFADTLELKVPKESQPYYWQNIDQPISYRRCQVCGRDVPSWLGFTIHPVMEFPGTENKIAAARKAMFPYDIKLRFICMRCIYEKLGFKPDWQVPGEMAQ